METDMEHLDVLVIGAGLSGIGAACRLRMDHPGRSVALLETRGRAGGTWDLFRYPGIRSDSDLYTFGYDFRPWREEKAIADGPSILHYLKETAAEYGVDSLIRYHHRVLSADWSSRDACWTVTVERTRTPEAGPDLAPAEPVGTGEILHLTAGWIFNAAGYYRYGEGYAPELPGRELFAGPVVHPQHWPENLDVAGKRIAVLGSGATAVTLVPALAELGARVTMVQRTPTYILPVPAEDPLARRLRGVVGPERTGRIMAEVSARRQRAIWVFCQRWPDLARKLIRGTQARNVPEGFELDKHLNPPYRPWDQRLCAVPDGDFFTALRSGNTTVVTGRTTGFTERGLRLASGEEVEADVVVTATGFTVQVLGGMELKLDGVPVNLAEHVAYRGVMLSGIPNMAFAIGYTNASWTLKVGLLTQWFSRLLSSMDRHGYTSAVPVAPPDMHTRPLLDFGAGYVQRSLSSLPRQGDQAPWLMTMNFLADRRDLQKGALADEYLHFSGDAGGADNSAEDRFVTLGSGLRLCYRIEGPDDGEPVVLLSGLGLDLEAWPAAFVQGLTAAGYRVIRPDNRDVGRSCRMDTPTPTLLHQVLARPMPGAYRIEDMADDVAGLLEHLQVGRAHVAGMSLGGMIAQSVAAHHPDRVLTLTSIISTTGARDVGGATFSTKRRFAARPPRTREEFIRARVALMRHLSGRTNPADPATEAELAGLAWDRGAYPDGGAARARQLGAINASADRTGALAGIRVPTLVIHGDRDPIVHPSGGAATVAAIPGSRLATIPGMGHYFSPAVVPELLRLVAGHLGARTADSA
ncbi:alpha/beta fold hydrolase [Arthrobacter sp. zg-Y1110]|uniref:alpha/beta fold hydrolase n=1 Tax=Arthrobacter sp. zg-Y1110 TaxID=2886932 RepID=UPI001D14495A|nr:alpha/beta fold hydrolase [Arthrobacter sp. zg-Y1110]MCC3290063.1 alpha/beta fold hydrolase [Arthrobacter sp. zg-Y1110]UWX84541.1 alpha/beta fold hydrolase [Arthrobacter sp. zg-Y1110]